jgi:hypothetical protein
MPLYTERPYAECHIFYCHPECHNFMNMLNVIMLKAIMLNAIMLNAIMLNAIMLNAMILIFITECHHTYYRGTLSQT